MEHPIDNLSGITGVKLSDMLGKEELTPENAQERIEKTMKQLQDMANFKDFRNEN